MSELKLRPPKPFAASGICYGVAWVGKALVAVWVNSKRTSQSLGTLWPLSFAGAKSQWRAAWRARSAKYLLGPTESKSAEVTLPVESTCNLTRTRTLPRMVAWAFLEGSGKTCSSTSPVAGADALLAATFGGKEAAAASDRSAVGAGLATGSLALTSVFKGASVFTGACVFTGGALTGCLAGVAVGLEF